MMGDEVDEDKAKEPEAGSSWWNAWPAFLQTAKEKSSTALEFMKRDLTEFSHVVQTDAAAAVSSTAALFRERLMIEDVNSFAGKAKEDVNYIASRAKEDVSYIACRAKEDVNYFANKARHSFTSVLETLSDVFIPQKEIEYDEAVMIHNSEPVVLDLWQSQLYTIRKDPKTYCHEPEGPPELYENWLESFNLDDHQEEMTEMMLTCTVVRTLYDELVPSAVSHLEFWQRYFYRVHLLMKTEAERIKLMKKHEQMLQNGTVKIDNCEVAAEKNVVSPMNSETVFQQSCTATSSEPSNLPSNSVENVDSKIIDFEKKTISSGQQINSKEINCEDDIAKELEAEIGEDTCIVTDKHIKSPSDENRSSPSDSASKGYSTGDEWEKDFELEVAEDNQQVVINDKQNATSSKETEEDWEKWE